MKTLYFFRLVDLFKFSWHFYTVDKTANSFSTIKLRSELVTWLRMEALRRGVFLYELVEDIVRPVQEKTDEQAAVK